MILKIHLLLKEIIFELSKTKQCTQYIHMIYLLYIFINMNININLLFLLFLKLYPK